jgi:hypothetical protein
MATRSSQSIGMTNATDAEFRAWAKFIFDTLVTTGGWVQTSDTGQINFTTVTRPTVANEKKGYIVVRMDDSLQATAPVFMRVDFGNSSTVGVPAIWVTIGPSSDGAGNINDAYLTPGTTSSIRANGTFTTFPVFSWGAAGTSWVAIAMGCNTVGANGAFVFMLERSKNGAGQDTGDGLILLYLDAEGNLNQTQYLYLDDTVQPPEELGIPTILSQRGGSAVASEDWGVAIPFPFAGIVVQPGINCLVSRDTDQSQEGRFVGFVYDKPHVYQTLMGVRARGTSFSRVLMRYE